MKQEADNLVARALKILKGDDREPSDEVLIEPAAANPRPVYWERADLSIVGPGRPEFLAKVGTGATEQFWVIVEYQEEAIWVLSDQLRPRKAFEQQVTPKPVQWIREPR